MSDWIEVGGKRYYEQGYLIMANKTAERRRESLCKAIGQLDAGYKRIRELEAHLQTTIEMKSNDHPMG